MRNAGPEVAQMPLGLLGKKLGMSQVFTPEGARVPVTVIQAGPCVITQKKTLETDGYNAIQVGFDPVPMHKKTRPEQGHLQKAAKGGFRSLREFRVEDTNGYEVGSELGIDMLTPGDKVDIAGKSKGRGFQGVFKRWGHHGGRATHGSMFHRAPGSMGSGTDPGRVRKGRKLPGHMGDKRITISGLEVVATYPEQNIVLVKGSVPGGRNTTLIIRKKK
jgi:large subunit ribosomal protein L3